MPCQSRTKHIGYFQSALILVIIFAFTISASPAAVWIPEVLSIGAFCFAITTLIYRASTVDHKGWQRASLVASVVGAVLVELLFFEPLGLSTLGQVIAFLILNGWGILAGLLFVEGLRWVQRGFLEEQGSL